MDSLPLGLCRPACSGELIAERCDLDAALLFTIGRAALALLPAL
jgi:hypothetical protein